MCSVAFGQEDEDFASVIVDYLVEIILFVDLIFSTRTSLLTIDFLEEYKDPITHDTVKDFELIAKHYMR